MPGSGTAVPPEDEDVVVVPPVDVVVPPVDVVVPPVDVPPEVEDVVEPLELDEDELEDPHIALPIESPQLQ